MKTKCARPCKSFKVTYFKYQNVSRRIDVKMLMVVGTEAVTAQTLQVLRPLLWGSYCQHSTHQLLEPHTHSQGALPTDGQESSLGSLGPTGQPGRLSELLWD